MTELEYQPKYRWRMTWPAEHDQDYSGWDGNIQFGRIFYECVGMMTGRWCWAGGYDPRIKMIVRPRWGWSETAGRATQKVEEHYEACLRLNGLSS
ncbi:hypothetical protein C9413_13535 [Rhizobium sp. SEMIA 4085]|nr:MULTISPECIES: hypothetical protein [Rhizobium]NNH30489.1 hypothetical protein [Rhizobium sp. SEMIA 4085]TDW16164.1 hypothetical protein EV128_14026 [Rhizobium azibense]